MAASSATDSCFRKLDTSSCPGYVLSIPELRSRVCGDGSDVQASSLRVAEVTDGNLNVVFTVRGPAGSLCLKQSLPYVRVVPTWPLFLERLVYEQASLTSFSKSCPQRVPAIYHFDPTMSVLCMELLDAHSVLRGELIAGRTFPELARHLAHFIAETCFATSDMAQQGPEKRKQVSFYSNNHPMCQLTEEVVFTCPYVAKPSFANRSIDADECPTLAAAAAALQRDSAWKAAAQELKRSFLGKAQALIHGDLHTGSVMVTPTDTRIIDSEFCMYGPIGYDIGNVVAHLAISFMAAVTRSCRSQDSHNAGVSCAGAGAGAGSGSSERPAAAGSKLWASQQKWLLATIKALWEGFTSRFTQLWNESAAKTGGAGGAGSVSTAAFIGRDTPDVLAAQQAAYLSDVFADSLGVAGLEITRRIVGVANVEDLSALGGDREATELALLSLSRWLIVSRQSVAQTSGIDAVVAALHAHRSRLSAVLTGATPVSSLRLAQDATFVMVSKFPAEGLCKTRLQPLLGEAGAAEFARQSLKDLLTRFTVEPCVREECGLRVRRVLLFAPADAGTAFRALLLELLGQDVANQWELVPVATVVAQSELSPNLGQKLGAALKHSVAQRWGPIVFLGMDTPTLTAQELREGVDHAAKGSVFLAPADDGGYVTLALPPHTNPSVFDGFKWSASSTGMGQLRRAQALGFHGAIGRTHSDVDTPEQLRSLARFLADDAALAALCPALSAYFAANPLPADTE